MVTKVYDGCSNPLHALMLALWIICRPWPTADETPPPILDYVKLTKENQELTAKLTEMERKYETATSLTKKVMTSMPRAARLNASLLSPTRTGLRA